MIGKVVGTVAKVITSPKAMNVVNVIFYTSSALKVGTELLRDWGTTYEIRMKTDEKIEEVVKDQFKDYLIDNRQELVARVLKDNEKAFLKSVSKNANK